MLWSIISLNSCKTVLRHMNQKENIVLKNHMTFWEPLIIYITASKSSLESFGGKFVTNKSHLWWQTLPLIHVHSADPLSRSCSAESWNQYQGKQFFLIFVQGFTASFLFGRNKPSSSLWQTHLRLARHLCRYQVGWTPSSHSSLQCPGKIQRWWG